MTKTLSGRNQLRKQCSRCGKVKDGHDPGQNHGRDVCSDGFLSRFTAISFPIGPDSIGISVFVLEQDPAAKRKKKVLDKSILCAMMSETVRTDGAIKKGARSPQSGKDQTIHLNRLQFAQLAWDPRSSAVFVLDEARFVVYC